MYMTMAMARDVVGMSSVITTFYLTFYRLRIMASLHVNVYAFCTWKYIFFSSVHLVHLLHVQTS